jgi:hypothetical protein
MLRFLTENGRNRSNSRQLSEILFFVKLKASKGKKNDILGNQNPFLKSLPFFVLVCRKLIIIHRCFKGCHAIPTPLPHYVKYILFNSGLPDNFHFIDEK